MHPCRACHNAVLQYLGDLSGRLKREKFYAQKFPQHVIGMIVRGTFLARDRDYRWFYQEGACNIFPDYWEEFLYPIPEEERDYYLERRYPAFGNLVPRDVLQELLKKDVMKVME